MNLPRINQFFMALLAVVFVMFTVSIISDSLFSSPAPETAGYQIQTAEAGTGDGGADSKAAETVSIATLLQDADVERGKNVFKRCAACHTAEKGGANKIGPHLWEIVNRPAASVSDFSYSAAMKEFGAENNDWDFDHLDHFLKAPKAYIKGTAMGFAGLKKDNERADLIAYLATLADTPVALPQPGAATEEAPAEETKPADEAQPAGEAQPSTTETPETAPEAVPEQPAQTEEAAPEDAPADAPTDAPADTPAEPENNDAAPAN